MKKNTGVNKVNIGLEKLNQIAKVSGLNQQQLAARIGITQSALSHYGSGRRRKIDPLVAMKICRAFPAIKMEEFYEGMNNK